FLGCSLAVFCLAHAILPQGETAEAPDKVLFNFEDASAVKDWAPSKLPELEKEPPAPRVEIVPAPPATDKTDAKPAGNCLKITFNGGDWPTIGTAKIPVPGNWKPFQTLKADVTVDRPSVAYFRICQGQPSDQPRQPRWEKTLMLLPGR